MSFWSALTGTTPQSEQERQLAALKAKHQAALDRRAFNGDISDDQLANEQDYEDSLYLDDTDAAALEGFKEGATEGWNNVLNAPGKLVGGAGSSAGQVWAGILKNIPWWVYLGLAGYAFFYLGGLRWLKGRLAQ